jgi:hypothetical protein
MSARVALECTLPGPSDVRYSSTSATSTAEPPPASVRAVGLARPAAVPSRRPLRKRAPVPSASRVTAAIVHASESWAAGCAGASAPPSEAPPVTRSSEWSSVTPSVHADAADAGGKAEDRKRPELAKPRGRATTTKAHCA